MLTCFFRLCLLLAFFLYAGCLGGPKVDPPSIGNERAEGPDTTGSGGSTSAEESMDSGIAAPINENPSGAGGQSEDNGMTKQQDSGVTDEDDDAGSTHES